MRELFKDRNFLIFWCGQFLSVTGAHVSLIAFPWLVLQLTGSPAMTGFVYAVEGLPRAVLLLAGGAVVDRYSPRAVMLVTNILRCLLVVGLAYLVYTADVSVGLVFLMALAFGLVDAFFYPANNAMVPSLVNKDRLKAGNALVQMTIYLSVVIGPMVAGLVIAGKISFAMHDTVDAVSNFESDRVGLARAFLLDGIAFALSFVTLLFVKARPLHEETEKTGPSMWQEIGEAIRWVWANRTVRLGFLGIASLEFFYQAPIFVGLPMLAKTRFAEGALVYGMELAAYGAGAFLGSLAAGIFKGPPPRLILRLMFWIFAYSGASLGLIVLFEPYEWAMAFFFVAGLGDSYMWVHFTTWLQRTTPEYLLGRVMSIFSVMAIGLLPVASGVMGLAFEWNLELALLITSGVMVACCVTAALHKDARQAGIE